MDKSWDVCGLHGRPWPCKPCVLHALAGNTVTFFAGMSAEAITAIFERAPVIDLFRFQREMQRHRLNYRMITCPVCRRVSYQPGDISEGYCGNCHWFTSDPVLLMPWLDEREEKRAKGSVESSARDDHADGGRPALPGGSG